MSHPANKPVFFTTEEEVMDAAIHSGRARPSIAQLPDGTYALCSRKTARRMGWTFLCRLWTGTTKAPAKPKAPDAAQRATDQAAVEAMLGSLSHE